MYKKKTPLEKLQDKIDKCNNHRGCASCCTQEEQSECPLVLAHTARMSWCCEHNINVLDW